MRRLFLLMSLALVAFAGPSVQAASVSHAESPRYFMNVVIKSTRPSGAYSILSNQLLVLTDNEPATVGYSRVSTYLVACATTLAGSAGQAVLDHCGQGGDDEWVAQFTVKPLPVSPFAVQSPDRLSQVQLVTDVKQNTVFAQMDTTEEGRANHTFQSNVRLNLDKPTTLVGYQQEGDLVTLEVTLHAIKDVAMR